MKRITITSVFALVFAMGSLWAQPADTDTEKDETTPAEEAAPETEKFAMPDGSSGEVKLIAGEKKFQRSSAKAEEYRDTPSGLSGSVSARHKSGGIGASVKAENIGTKDQTLRVVGENYGNLRVTGSYNSMVHNYGYDIHTPYGGVGTGYLSIAPSMKLIDLTPGTGGSTTCTSSSGAASNGCEPIAAAVGRMQGIANRLDNLIAMMQPVDIAVRRERGSLKIDLMALEPVRMNVTWNHEKRSGTMPFANGFGSPGGQAMEFPAPVNYLTNDGRFTLEYASKHIYAMAAYSASRFNNEVNTLLWDNPFSTVDGTGGAPSLTVPTTGTAPNTKGRYTSPGPIMGRMALPPDNLFQHVTASLMFKELPRDTKVDMTAAFGWARQDDALLPYTTNTFYTQGSVVGTGAAARTLPWDYSNPYALPRPTAKAAVDTAMYNIVVTSRPLSFLHTRARYRVYEYVNKTEEFLTPGFVVMDSGFSSSLAMNERPGYKKQTGTLDADFQILSKTNLTVTYNNEWMKREEREAKNQHEDTYKANLDQRFGDLGSLVGLSYSEAKRTGDYDPFEPFTLTVLSNPSFFTQTTATYPVVNPMMRKFDEANRHRKQGDVHANWQVAESFAVGGKVIGARDFYPDSEYGLRQGTQRTGTMDVEWNPVERFAMNASYALDRFDVLQRNRQWTGTVDNPYTTPASTGPYSGSDWTAERLDKTKTYALDFRFDILLKKLIFHVSLMDTMTDGKIRYVSPVSDVNNLQTNLALAAQAGTSSISTDTNNFFAQNLNNVYDNRYQKFEGKLEWLLDEMTTLTVGDRFERFTISDFGDFGFDYVPRNTAAYGSTVYTGLYNNMIMMDVYPKPYKMNYAYVTYMRKF